MGVGARRFLLSLLMAGCASDPPVHLFDEVTDAVLPGEAPVPLDPADQPCETICVGPSIGVGAAAADVDGDGRVDLYLAGPAGGRLFMNRTPPGGAIRLEPAALDVPAVYVHGAAFGDLDGDGAPELLLATATGLRVLLNHDGALADAPQLARPLGISSSVTVGDLDNDGLLDVYVAEYDLAGTPTSKAGPGLMLLNRGDLVFEDLAAGWPGRHAWTGLMADLDRDGRLDLFVAAETWADFLDEQHASMYFNDGNDPAGRPRLDDSAQADLWKRYTAPMGAAVADLDGDGSLEMIVTLIGPSLFLSRDPGAAPRDFTGRSFFGPMSREDSGHTSWGAAWGDWNHDGRLELLLAGGAPCVPDKCADVNIPPSQSSRLYTFDGDRFGYDSARPIPLAGGLEPPDPSAYHASRGAVLADLDGDGRDELVLTPFGDRFHLYASAVAGGHRLRVRLRGQVSARDPYGAEVTVTAGGRRRTLQLVSGGSTHSQSEPALTFEIGSASRADVEVRWPSGLEQTLHDVAAGALVVDEPARFSVPRRRLAIGQEAELFVQRDDPAADDPAGIEVLGSDGLPFAVDALGGGRFRAHRAGLVAAGTLSVEVRVDALVFATRPLLTFAP